MVAFHARYDAGGAGIFRGDGTGITTVVDTSNPDYLGNFLDPAIDVLGTVAFQAQTRYSGTSVQAGPDPFADRVVGTAGSLSPGTPLFDEPGVTGTSFYRNRLSRQGQLTGTATLPRGGEVVWRANPPATETEVVPEPGTAVLLGCAGAAWAGLAGVDIAARRARHALAFSKRANIRRARAHHRNTCNTQGGE